MLTFFRKIRQGLLKSGKGKRYLLYAIGEIALVVVGILIALQINNWNEERKRKIQGKEYLKEIYQELTRTEVRVGGHIEFFNIQSKTTHDILFYLEQPEKKIADKIIFIKKIVGYKNEIRNVLSSILVDRPQSTWDDLQSSGGLAMLNDAALVEKLQEYYTGYDYLVSNYNGFPMEYIYNARKETIRLLDLENIDSWWFEEKLKVPSSSYIDKLRSNEEFKEQLYGIMTTSKAQITWFGSLLESTQSIVDYMEEKYEEFPNQR